MYYFLSSGGPIYLSLKYRNVAQSPFKLKLDEIKHERTNYMYDNF